MLPFNITGTIISPLSSFRLTYTILRSDIPIELTLKTRFASTASLLFALSTLAATSLTHPSVLLTFAIGAPKSPATTSSIVTIEELKEILITPPAIVSASLMIIGTVISESTTAE